jgi:CRP/FNR family transcriptional regulator, cyclic AMP receptor protein
MTKTLIPLLIAAGAARLQVPQKTVLLRQGEPATGSMFFIVSGEVALTVVSDQGRAAILSHLGPTDFVGEESLSAQANHSYTATAVSPCGLLHFNSSHIRKIAATGPAIGDYVMSFLIRRLVNVEAEMINLIFNSSEKRLARTLLKLAKYGTRDGPRPISHMTHEMLAERVGTTRARITHFMNKFRRLGLIEYNGAIKVHSKLSSVVLGAPRATEDHQLP